jgi:hypothetical protein
MRHDSARPGGWQALRATVCLAPMVALAACGTPLPTVDQEPSTPAAVDEGAGEGAPRGVALAPDCSEIPERSYQPPPEDQPPADPALTTAEAILDVPIEEPAEPEIVELEDGEEVRIAPEAPQTPVGALQTEGPVEWPDHFGGVWGDRRHGSMVVGFTDDVERYAELVRERYGAAWWVVEVEHSERELLELQEDIGSEMGRAEGPGVISWTASGTGSLNRVSIGILEPSDERLAELAERYGADRICFEIERTPTADDAEVAPWEPAPDADLTPAATSIEVLVNERACASGTSAEGRIAPPTVEYGPDTVTITLAVIPVTGGADCPGNPDTPFTVELDEPLGDRTLLDGGTSPPSSPSLDEQR